MKRNHNKKGRPVGSVVFIITAAINAVAQSTLANNKEVVASANRWWYTMIIIALAGLGGAYYFWRKDKKRIEQPEYNNRTRDHYTSPTYVMSGLDSDKQLNRLRNADRSPARSETWDRNAAAGNSSAAGINARGPDDLSVDTKVFQQKMKMLRYAQLPINSFNELSPAKNFRPLEESADRSLLSAIDQVNEEREDGSVRELAVRTLAAFRTSNSVEALSRIALYDVSSGLRSRAVSILAEIDHESVFETILLACADPTREVRAAAARGLFSLSFDRSGAWRRIIEIQDEFRMGRGAQAAIEAGIAVKSFDRLLHDDLKVAYEAFTLVALMIRSGEDKEIFEAIRDHKDERVKFALLHVIKAIGDERSISGLHRLRMSTGCPDDVLDQVLEVITSLENVPAERPV